jgi:hypothetical protein
MSNVLQMITTSAKEKTVIVDLADLASRLENDVLLFWSSNFTGDCKSFLRDALLTYVEHALRDNINNRLAWSITTVVSENILKDAIRHCVSPTTIQTLSFNTLWDLFFCKYLDQFELEVDRLINTIVTPNLLFRVWHTRRAHTMFVIDCGEDYRILDWTRRMGKGEWKKENWLDTIQIDETTTAENVERLIQDMKLNVLNDIPRDVKDVVKDSSDFLKTNE